MQRQRAGAANEEPQFLLSISPPLSIAASYPAQPVSSSGLSLRVHSDLDEVREQWKAFEQQADRTVFQSFDWLAAWQRHIGARRGTVPAIVLGRDADGQLLFILQLAIETHGLTRRLTWLGSQLCDYNAPLLAEPFSDRMSAERFVLAWQDVIKLLCAEERWRFDLIDLQKMPEAVGAQRNPFLDLRVLAHPSGAYDTELWLYDHVAAGTLQGSLVMATTTTFRRTKRIIKQSPALWRAFSKARALAGLLGRR